MKSKHFFNEVDAIKEHRIRLTLEAHTLYISKAIPKVVYADIAIQLKQIERAELAIKNILISHADPTTEQ